MSSCIDRQTDRQAIGSLTVSKCVYVYLAVPRIGLLEPVPLLVLCTYDHRTRLCVLVQGVGAVLSAYSRVLFVCVCVCMYIGQIEDGVEWARVSGALYTLIQHRWYIDI